MKFISSVGSQILVTPIFTKTTFCQRENTKRMAHNLSNSRSSRPIRTPLKSINHASKHHIYERYHHFGAYFMPRSHIHGSPRRFYYGLNLTDDPGNANFRSPIRMHYIRMIKYHYVWLRMQYGKLRTYTDCHEWCQIVSVANPASGPWICELGITGIWCFAMKKMLKMS